MNLVKNENNGYLKSISDILSTFKSENGKSLDQIMSDLKSELTDIYLDNLNIAFGNSLEFTFKTINEIIENNKNLGNQYMTNVKKSNSIHITNGFKSKYNIFYNSIQNINDYINKYLKNNLANKYKNVMTQIRSLLQSIKSNSILEKYYKQLPSAEQHVNYINNLFEVFHTHISDNTFNIKFLPLINNFIKSKNESCYEIKKNFQNIYNEMAKKGYYAIGNDYDTQRQVYEYYCCGYYSSGRCRRQCGRYVTVYDGYNVAGTNNYLYVKSINFPEYTKEFDNKYNELYPAFYKNILSYNSLLSKLDIKIEGETQKDFFKEKIVYLDNISQKVKSIIEEKLGNNLLIASYNYFKNKITNKLPNELNNITEEWGNAYDEAYNNLESNKSKFKSSIKEFFYLSYFYHQVYCANISYSYSESIVEKLKNDFNYTNRYYYNIIISKLNKTFSYILSNLPINEKPFDEILNKRIIEIKTSHNNILNELKNSYKEILDKIKQEVILKVNEKNFFYVNDIINNHIKSFNSTINAKAVKFNVLASLIQNDNPEELIAAKFYLENSINGKQIKDNYDMINKASFIDLQTDVYQKLIDDIWKIDRDELIKNILTTLTKLNEINNNNFKYEKAKYIELLQNKLYEEFFTKADLITKINSFFLNGINNCNVNSKYQIDILLNTVLNKVKTHLSNEAKRLDYELTSYSNVFTNIVNRLNSYKNEIYNQFYSAIIYVIHDFYQQILEKFYKNYIQLGLNEFEMNINKINFGKAQFLNMSINLNDILDKESKNIIYDYGNLTLNQIQFLYQKNIETLNRLFNFSSIKTKINTEIDNAYRLTLLPKLQKVGIYKSGNEGVSNYDLSQEIIKDINNSLNEQINKTKAIIKSMEGKEYKINDIPPADFSAGKDNVYDKITNMFTTFTLTYASQEKKEFDKIVIGNATNNFKTLMNNFIPSFGVDFFNRILRFNEIQKINMLYHNLKYTIGETILYYVGLVTINKGKYLPVDIKLILFALNNLDSIVKIKNDFIVSTLNDRLDSHFEETKNYIVNKYINDMNTNAEFDLKFNTDLIAIIKGLISGNVYNYENYYINMMKENIKAPFISEYTKVLNEATNDMKNYIERSKVDMKVHLDSMFSTNSDTVLADIQIKLNKTKNNIEEYNNHFGTFKLSQEVIDFLDNFGDKMIVPKYSQIKELLDKKSAELVLNNLEKHSNDFKKEYSEQKFQEEINKMNKNLSTYFDKYSNILKKYGSIEDTYNQNLEKEIANYRRIRLLEETNNNENNNKKTKIKLDDNFNQLKNTSTILKGDIQSLDLFNDFENSIKKNINERNNEYSITEYTLEKNKKKYENYDLMVERLNELNKLSSEYYTKTQNIYDNMKQELIDKVNKINELINSCENVTHEVINSKYLEIKEKFNKIERTKDDQKEQIKINPYKTNKTANFFVVETKIENYFIHNKFYLDIVFDEESKTQKVVGKVINNIKPKTFDIDLYSSTGQNGKLGRMINVVFNNISSYSNITFDSRLNRAEIVTNFNFEEYKVNTQYYEEKIENIPIDILGMTIIVPGVSTIVNIETPDEEKLIIIPLKNETIIENYLY